MTHDIDEQKPDNQARINTLFKPGKVSGAATSTPAKRAPAKRGSKKAQPAERAQQAQHAQQPEHAEQAQQSEEAEHAQQPAAAAAASDRDFAAAGRETDAGAMPADNASLGDQGSLSARAARHLSRIHQQPPTELLSPSEPWPGKRRRAATPADVSRAPNQMAFVYEHCGISVHSVEGAAAHPAALLLMQSQLLACYSCDASYS